MPPDLAHVWVYFQDLCSTRMHTTGGLQAITYTEIENYSRRMRLHISPFETALIRALDDLALKALQTKPTKNGVENEVGVDDGAGAIALLRRLAKKPTSARPDKRARPGPGPARQTSG